MITKTLTTTVIEPAMDENGFPIDGETVTNTFDTIHIYADEGKIFVRKADGMRLTNHIQLGTMDSVDNYDEVEK